MIIEMQSRSIDLTVTKLNLLLQHEIPPHSHGLHCPTTKPMPRCEYQLTSNSNSLQIFYRRDTVIRIMTKQKCYRLTSQTGYFLQDDPKTNPETFDYASVPNSMSL